MKVVKKTVKIFLCLFLVGILCLAGINVYVMTTAQRQVQTIETLKKEKAAGKNSDKPYDAAVVLGAQVRGTRMSIMLRERVETGIELYKAGIVDRLIMSGDHESRYYDEVNVMKEYAVEQGVPSNHIFMDHAGLSTYDSMYRTQKIFQAKKVIVVTQKYHLYRAVYDGKRMGLDVTGVACNKSVYRGDTKRKIREILAQIKDFGYTIIKPKPTYLGEPIPVSGNGDVTNDADTEKMKGKE